MMSAKVRKHNLLCGILINYDEEATKYWKTMNPFNLLINTYAGFFCCMPLVILVIIINNEIPVEI